MYVREIRIKSFRHLESVTLGPFTEPPLASDLIALAGPNGGGKSSILELLSFALSNSWSLSWSLPRAYTSNSFEVAIGITKQERELVKEYVRTTSYGPSDDVVHYLDEYGFYYRGFNLPEGEYNAQASLYNKTHNLITSALRNHYNRPLGFFLRSDRYYPTQAFNRNTLFEIDKRATRDYVWDKAFNTSEVQYRDMFEFLIHQRWQYVRQLGEYYLRERQKGPSGTPAPTDPLEPYDRLLQRLFPFYRISEEHEDVPSDLFVQIPSNETLKFSDLSAGEKEVFFVLSFFLRINVSNAIVVIDEPEMHLHPELSRLLIRTMQSIKPGNQIWVATHNPEIIDEAGRDRVTYIARDPGTRKSTITLGRNEPEAILQLRNLFGYSGYIGIAKALVFLEGKDSSSDRKLFASLFPEHGSQIKFVPALGADELPRLNAAILAILESQLGWMQCFLIRDRDFLVPEAISKYEGHASGRLFVLKRYHIENYLLDDEAIASIQTELFGKATTGSQVLADLRAIACTLSGEVLRNMVTSRLHYWYAPQDFSLGNLLKGQQVVDANGTIDAAKAAALRAQVRARTEAINEKLVAKTTPAELEALIASCEQDVVTALAGGDGWRTLFPGRRLLEEYASVKGLGEPIVLQNALIKHLGSTSGAVPVELNEIIKRIIVTSA